MINELLTNINPVDEEIQGSEVIDSEELTKNSEEMLEYQGEIVQHIETTEQLDMLDQEIEQQEEILNQDQEPTVQQVINAEASLESYCNLFAGASRQKVIQRFNMESIEHLKSNARC